MVVRKRPRRTEPGAKGRAKRPTHDIIVIGASAGGVEALKELVRCFPPDLPASVFVVLHVSATPPSILPEILSRCGPLQAIHPKNAEAIEPGRIYVAPPEHHLTLERGFIRVTRGPRENGHRAAVNSLFRTAARVYGPRVVGVVLTEALDDGTAGLMSIKSRGGLAVVQDPNEAVVPDMPRSAIAHLKVDYILPLSKISSLIARLAREPIGGKEIVVMEAKKLIKPSPITCPECNGSMVESEVGGLVQFQYHVGHIFSMDGLASVQAEALEAALWAGVRALEETEDLARRIASRSERKIAGRLIEKAEAMKSHAQLLQRMLLGGDWMLASDEAHPPRKQTGKTKKVRK